MVKTILEIDGMACGMCETMLTTQSAERIWKFCPGCAVRISRQLPPSMRGLSGTTQ